jgi:hypothetical protein
VSLEQRDGFNVSARRAAMRASLRGYLELEEEPDRITPWRLPSGARRHAPVALSLMAEFTAGVRMLLRTDADRLEIDASIIRLVMRHLGRPAAPARFVAQADGLDIVVEVDDTGLVVETPEREFARGPVVRSTVVFELPSSQRERDVVVWLPHDAGVSLHDLRGMRSGRPTRVEAAAPVERRRWVHHGSSISHGGSATLPTMTWPALAARALDVDVLNLGFGGNAMLDPMTARAIAAAPADVITLKIGINIVGGDAMRSRVFVPALHGFLDTVREGHPETPIVLVTAIGCRALESAPGPLRPAADGRVASTPRQLQPGDGTLTLERTRELIADAVADRSADDSRLAVVDGQSLLSADEDMLLPDGLHPDDAGYGLIADRFVALAQDQRTPLGRAFR